ncbi:MAG: UvrD-helicase domain-containing protein [Candidatus Omnitrophica bacterium]|nr:UvrD-helicase domain-containing protein [Candidatus Omnitrophota bacterium]
MDKQIIVVEASAGSGKTYALARRYLKLLLNASVKQEDEGLRSILAITFMNKAAVEMKERILELLKRIALDTFRSESQKKDLLDYVGLDEKACREASFQAMQEIIRRYDYFQVQTIDSFVNSLLLGCAFRLGLSANFNIREDYNKYIALSLDQLLDLAAQRKETKDLFIDFVWHYLRIESQSGWLAKNDILSVTKSLFSEFNRYGVPFYSHPINDKEIVAQKKVVYQKISKILKEIDLDGINKGFVKGIKGFVEENDEHFQLDGLKSAYWEREEIAYNKGALVSKELNAEWDKLRVEIRALCEMEAYSLFNPYIEIFNKVLEFFLLQSQKEDILFLEELNARASQLFGKDTISVPEIFIRIGSRFQHFLIDEFQDTSVLQWNNIFLLAEEALSTGGSLFYVGDKKQAIYRFRGGEAKLFNGVKKELEQFGKKEEVLSSNYRSSKEIIEFNNRIFSPENLQNFIASYNAHQEEKSKNDASFRFFPFFEQELLQVFSHSVQNPQPDKPVGYVSVDRFDILSSKLEERDYDSEAQEDEESPDIVKEKLLKLIKELHDRSFEYKDIAVLSRSAVNVEKISGWLIEKGVPVESERTLNIRENGLIKEITSFLKFLDSPIDNLSFASFILGEIFCAASGISKAKIEDFIFRNRKNKKDQHAFAPYLYRAFKKEFPQTWEKYIEIFFKNVGFMPLYEMLVTIYANFGALVRFPDNQSFFMSFLELIKKKEDEHSGIKAFLEYFNDAINKDLYVKFPSSNAVKVMTVHKAKGLEFPVVIIPFLKIGPKGESSTDNRSTSYTPNLDRQENVLRLLRLKKEYRRFSPEIQARYNEEYFRSFIDELNNIYVSFTRARQELYVFIANKPGKTSTVDLLIPSDFTELGSKGEPLRKEAEKESQYTLGPSHYSDWIEMLKNEFKDSGQLKSHKQIKRGEVMHYVFSLLGNLYGKDLDVELSRCMDLTQVRFPEFDDFEGVKEKIKTLISDDRFKELFFCSAGKIFTEKEVVNRFGETKRIDWLIVKDATAVIVDFKSGSEVDDQGKQVKEYIDLISAIYPKKKVSGCLLYVDDLKIKEVS